MSNSEFNHYFPHDSNARSDDKMLSLRSELGNKAYAIYFMILELMREEDNYCLNAEGNLVGRLSMELNEPKEFMEEFIEKSQEFGLLKIKDEKLYSEEFLRRMAYKDDKSKQAKKAANVRWHGDSNGDEEDEQSDSNADAMQEQGISNANKKNNKKKKNKNNKKEIKLIYNYWKEKSETISHRKLTTPMKDGVGARLDNGFTVDELKEAIDNYNMVVKSDDYFFSYNNWSLNEFMSRGEGEQVEKFLGDLDAYLHDDEGSGKNNSKRRHSSMTDEEKEALGL